MPGQWKRDRHGELRSPEPLGHLEIGSAAVEADVAQLVHREMAQGAAAELKPRHYAAVSDRDVLLRLQNNIKLRLVQKGDLPGAADVVERMLLISPAAGPILVGGLRAALGRAPFR